MNTIHQRIPGPGPHIEDTMEGGLGTGLSGKIMIHIVPNHQSFVSLKARESPICVPFYQAGAELPRKPDQPLGGEAPFPKEPEDWVEEGVAPPRLVVIGDRGRNRNSH